MGPDTAAPARRERRCAADRGGERGQPAPWACRQLVRRKSPFASRPAPAAGASSGSSSPKASLLTLLGGALGVVLATWMVGLLRLLLPETAIARNLALSYRLDGGTLGLAFLVTLAIGLVFGLAARPAGLPRQPQRGPEGGRAAPPAAATPITACGRRSWSPRPALAAVLLVSAGLCIKGLQKARQIDFGVEPKGVLIAELQVGMNGYTEQTAKTLYRRIQQRLAALPGVEEAALASWFPLGLAGCKGSRRVSWRATIGRPARTADPSTHGSHRATSR